MLRFCSTLLALLLLTSGISAQSVQQSGSVTPGHAAMWSGTGIVKDAGTAASGNLSTLGVTNNSGAAICISSDVSTAAGRNQLCFSATTNGGTKISSYIYGTATNPGIVFDINGSTQGFPAVTLPVVSGNLACFDGTTGQLKACTSSPITGNNTFSGSNYFDAQFGLSGDITPAALSGDVNDYSPTGFSSATIIRQDGGAANRNITGLAGGVDGRIVQIINIGATNNLVLKNESSSSTAADRFLISADITLGVNRAVVLRYDGVTTRWRIFTGSSATGTLGLNQIVLGGGAGADPFSIPCTSAGTVLHGGSPPACSAIVGSDLPNPSTTTLGGVFSKAAVANTFVTGIDNSGNVLTAVVTLSNPFSTGGVQYGGNITSGANYNILYGPDLRNAIQIGGAGDLTNYSKATNGLVVTNNDGSVVFGSIISSGLRLNGATSGTLTLAAPAIAGANTLTFPAGTTNFSATGGASQVVKQTSSGGAFTVAQLACSDLSGVGSGCSSAAGVPLTGGAITSSSATAFSVGLNGATNPSFNVDDSTALQVAGLSIKGAVTGGTVALTVIDSGAAANLSINAKGTGTIGIGSVSTGVVTFTPAVTMTGASANSLAVGPNGTTNPTLNIDDSTASAATGLNVKSAAAGGGIALSTLSSGTNESLSIAAKGTGNVTLSNGGGQMVIFRAAASSVNFLDITGGAATGGSPSMTASGTDTDIALPFSSKGAGSISWYTSSFGALQVQFLHTASANRNLTFTGSNGGNPTISTTAGNLAVTPALVGGSYLQTATTTVGSLPSCAAGTKGARHFVTDANATFTAGIGAVVAAGGANNVPVTCDGTNWRIG